MMKRILSTALVPLFCTVLLHSCLQEKTPLEPYQVQGIVKPAPGSVFHFGDAIRIEAVFNDRNSTDPVQLRVNGVVVAETSGQSVKFILDRGIQYRPGILNFKVVVPSTSGDEYTDSVSVFVESDGIPVYDFQILQIYDHDAEAFTQGLVYDDGIFYESTGLYGESSLRRITVETGEVLQIRYLANNFFAEGLTLWEDRLIQLTWREQTGFIYNKSTFDSLDSFSYTTEGWGLTHDGSRLIMSDGSAQLYFLDPESFEVLSSSTVQADGLPVLNINELEYIYGDVFANIWRSVYIARIDPRDSRVIAWIDLRQLSENNQRGVLNGIAFDEELQRFFVTGKRWMNLYEIDLIPRKQLLKKENPIYALDEKN